MKRLSIAFVSLAILAATLVMYIARGVPFLYVRSTREFVTVPVIFNVIRQSDVKEVEHILHNNPLSIEATDFAGRRPLHAAVNQGSYQIVEILLKAGANPNSKIADSHYGTENHWKGWTPAHCAVDAGNLEILKLLYQYGGSVTLEADGGVVPYDLAVISEQQDIIDWLITVRGEEQGSAKNKGRESQE